MSMQVQPQGEVPPLVRIDAHYRKSIAFRWAELIVRAAIVTSLAFTLVPGLLLGWNYSLLGALGTMFLFGPLLYLVTVQLVLRVRRSWIESPPTLPAPSSRLSMWFGTFTPRVVAFLAAHAVFGCVYALGYAWALNTRSAAVKLAWLSPTNRHPWHWNERLWFLVFGNSLFFSLLAMRDILKSNIGPFWPKAKTPFPLAVQRSLVACFTRVNGSGTVACDITHAVQFTAAYSFAYFALRRAVWRLAVTNIAFLRPFAINFAKTGAARTNMTWSLGWYLFVLEVTAILSLKPALAVLNDYLCQPLPFQSFTKKAPLTADKYLLTALGSSNAFYVDHTVVELQRVARNPERRKEIFGDTSRPALTHALFRALLLALGDEYAVLASGGRRGNGKNPATVGVGIAPAPQNDPHTLAVRQGDIFKPPQKPTGFRGLVATVLEGKPRPTPEPVRAAAAGLHRAEIAVASRLEADKPAAEQWVENLPFLGPALGAAQLVRGGFARWAGREWARRSVGAAVPEPDRLARLVDTMTTLVVASADEDVYGYVQAVLPSVLEAFVRVRSAAHALATQLTPLAPKVSSTAAEDVRAATARIAAIPEQGILRIAERFGPTLTTFRFPSHVAQALTDVCR